MGAYGVTLAKEPLSGALHLCRRLQRREVCKQVKRNEIDASLSSIASGPETPN